MILLSQTFPAESIRTYVDRYTIRRRARYCATTTPTTIRQSGDTTDHGWPEEYEDPRDRPHPTILRVTVERFGEMREGTLDAVEAIGEGEEQPAVVSFETVEELRRILTDRRIELLHDDVTLLAEYGLLYVVEEGRTNRPYLPYRRIHLDVDIVGDHRVEESATA